MTLVKLQPSAYLPKVDRVIARNRYLSFLVSSVHLGGTSFWL